MENDLFGKIRGSKRFFLIAGPCVVENIDICFNTAEHISRLCSNMGLLYIFKSSVRKANRTNASSFTGIGNEQAFGILKAVKEKLGIPVITDVHSLNDIDELPDFIDCIQIPAFLSRQTELLIKAGETGKPVNIKKGQFMSPVAMHYAAHKVSSTGNEKIMLTERGTTFGYNDLVIDYRNIPLMKNAGYPVVLDCTHSLQKPNQEGGITGGQPELIETVARAGIAAGADGIFIETHPEPEKALSDGANMLPLSRMKDLLETLVRIDDAVKQ